MDEIKRRCAQLRSGDLPTQLAACKWLAQQSDFAVLASMFRKLGYDMLEIAEMLSPCSNHPAAALALQYLEAPSVD